jgi:hypothetical protein
MKDSKVIVAINKDEEAPLLGSHRLRARGKPVSARIGTGREALSLQGLTG